MSTDILISQLMLIPVLVIFSWIYLRLRSMTTKGKTVLLFDVAVIVAAIGVSVYGLVLVAHLDVQRSNLIWKPVLSIVTTFHLFSLVLCCGWWLRRKLFEVTV